MSAGRGAGECDVEVTAPQWLSQAPLTRDCEQQQHTAVAGRVAAAGRQRGQRGTEARVTTEQRQRRSEQQLGPSKAKPASASQRVAARCRARPHMGTRGQPRVVTARPAQRPEICVVHDF
jgi:hypothetical protein